MALRIAPVAPKGCPKAIAPPNGLTLAGSSCSSCMTATACAANASFNSIQSMASCFKPAKRSAAGIASLGPMPMISGATPLIAKLTKRAKGVKLNCFSAFSLTISKAPAPSEVCELLPAVTLPLAANTARNLASPSSDVSARGPSSWVNGCQDTSTSPSARFILRCAICTANVSALNSPAACAANAF